MKGNTRYAAFAAMLLATAAFAAQDGILLRRELKEGTTDTYKLDMKMSTVIDVPGAGEQEMSFDSIATYAIKIAKVDAEKGLAAVEVTTKVEKMNSEGMMSGAINGQKMPDAVTLKGTLDRQARLKTTTPKGGDALGDMLGSQASAFSTVMVELPDKPVKIGDSWQIVVPKSTMSKKDQFLTATLKGEKDFEGKAVWIVALDGKIKLVMDPKPMPKDAGGGQPNPLAGQKMAMKADIHMTGEGLVDKATGQTLLLNNKAKTDQEVSFPDMGMSMKSNSTMNVVMTLVK